MERLDHSLHNQSPRNAKDSGANNLVNSNSSSYQNPTVRLVETAVNVRQSSKCVQHALLKLENPKSVMIVTKLCDDSLAEVTKQLADWFMSSNHSCFPALSVYVDSKFATHPVFQNASLPRSAPESKVRLLYWDEEFCRQHVDDIDFIITLGGDGTVLYAAWLFQNSSVPMLIPFHFGSLGFLTVFHFLHIQSVLEQIIGRHASGVPVSLRMRLECTVWRKRRGSSKPKSAQSPLSISDSYASTGVSLSSSTDFAADDGSDVQVGNHVVPVSPYKQSKFFSSRYSKESSFHVLNEIVVERGPYSCLAQLELYANENHLTTMQADGVVVATPTGSTAYSLSAGGSLVHPSVPAILITPIAPHTLNFRPMILPDTIELRIEVPKTARTSAWMSFDGRDRIELYKGDQVSITASPFPVITVAAENQHSDWFASLNRCLHWNERIRQQGIPQDQRPSFKNPSSTCDFDSKLRLLKDSQSGKGRGDTVLAARTEPMKVETKNCKANVSQAIEDIWNSHQSRKVLQLDDYESDVDSSTSSTAL